MRKIIFSLMLVSTIVSACLPPLKPLPPLGCSSDDAVLVTETNGQCYWVFISC